MLKKYKLTAIRLFNDPNTRAFLILSSVVFAALIGGAPNDGGGSG